MTKTSTKSELFYCGNCSTLYYPLLESRLLMHFSICKNCPSNDLIDEMFIRVDEFTGVRWRKK